ncbi:MAG: hypothetical protein IMY71_15565 [Bacteroidetes bacterium]|nr:hypothetical protein [Bacteroidota bacterium]
MRKKPYFLPLTGCFIRKIYFKDRVSRSRRTSAYRLPDPTAIPQKDIFYIIDRACPTNGSDCGSFLTQSNLIR